MKKFFACYLLGAMISWFLMSGWQFAYFAGQFPNQSMREHSGFATIWSALASTLWPVTLPVTYCITGYAEYGWRPVWKLHEGKP